MTKRCWIISLLFVIATTLPANATLMPPQFLDRVVAIGRIEASPGPTQGQWIAEATGFLYGEFLSKVDEKQSNYHVYLVTNRHVIQEHSAITPGPLMVKFNLEGEATSRMYAVDLVDSEGKPTWHAHPNPAVDVAIIPIDANVLRGQGARFDFFRSDNEMLDRVRAKEIGLSEGDGVYVLGFPMGLVGKERDYAIVRQGCIARIRDSLNTPQAVQSFLIDALIFPGSSGAPVVLKPEVFFITGTRAIDRPYLLGIVKGYIPYTDVAFSLQTKRPRITFEENSGLAEIIPIDFVEETIQHFRSSLKK